MLRKKIFLLIGSLILVGVLVLSFYPYHTQEDIQDDGKIRIIAYINQEPIEENEFKLIFTKHRGDVLSYFHRNYKVDSSDDFWRTDYKGEIPAVMAKELTLNTLTRIKAEQKLMKEKGIIEDMTYSTYLKALEKENERRRVALKNNQVIYGPKQYTEDTYYDYLHSTRLHVLKDKLSKDEFAITEEELNTYYENTKDRYPDYKKADFIKVRCIKITYGQGDKDTVSREKAIKLIQEAEKALQTKSFDDVMTQYNENNEEIEIVFDDTTYRENVKNEIELYGPISELKVGEVSEIIQFNSAFYIVDCIEREEGKYRTFDEYRETIWKNYVNEQFIEYLDQLVEEVSVNIVDKVYNNYHVE